MNVQERKEQLLRAIASRNEQILLLQGDIQVMRRNLDFLEGNRAATIPEDANTEDANAEDANAEDANAEDADSGKGEATHYRDRRCGTCRSAKDRGTARTSLYCTCRKALVWYGKCVKRLQTPCEQWKPGAIIH
jgi:hypothetical protein